MGTGSRESDPFIDSDPDDSLGSGSDGDGDVRGDEPISPSLRRWQDFEKSNQWQWFVNGIILCNTYVLALEADNPNLWWESTVDNVFLAIFVAELSFRLALYRKTFFTNEDMFGWNMFDSLVVLLGVFDQWVMGLLFTGSTSAQMSSAVAALRVIRLLRVLRALRLFKYFKPLRLLAAGLIGSLSSVFWIAMMFLSLVFVSAIFTTSLVGKDPERFEDPERIRRWFGTMLRSMETLSIFLTCDDWSTPVRMVIAVYPWMELFFIWYMVMGAFLTLSLLTGLMADKMKEARDEDETELKTNPEKFEKRLQELKDRVDAKMGTDHDIYKQDFVELTKDEGISKALADAGLKDMDEHQREWLFKAIDRDGSGALSWKELSDSLGQISRHSSPSASPLEIMKVEGVLAHLDRRLQDWRLHARSYSKDVCERGWDHRLESVHARSALLKARVRAIQADLMEFFQAMKFDPASAILE